MSMRTIDMLDEQIDAIVIESLKESVLINRNFTHQAGYSELDAALLKVLDYYMDPDSYGEFVRSVTPA